MMLSEVLAEMLGNSALSAWIRCALAAAPALPAATMPRLACNPRRTASLSVSVMGPGVSTFPGTLPCSAPLVCTELLTVSVPEGAVDSSTDAAPAAFPRPDGGSVIGRAPPPPAAGAGNCAQAACAKARHSGTKAAAAPRRRRTLLNRFAMPPGSWYLLRRPLTGKGSRGARHLD